MTSDQWMSTYDIKSNPYVERVVRRRRLHSVVANEILPRIRVLSGFMGKPAYTTPDPKVLTTTGGMITSCSSTLEEWSGWTADEMLGTELSKWCKEQVFQTKSARVANSIKYCTLRGSESVSEDMLILIE